MTHENPHYLQQTVTPANIRYTASPHEAKKTAEQDKILSRCDLPQQNSLVHFTFPSTVLNSPKNNSPLWSFDKISKWTSRRKYLQSIQQGPHNVEWLVLQNKPSLMPAQAQLELPACQIRGCCQWGGSNVFWPDCGIPAVVYNVPGNPGWSLTVEKQQ